jgi:hypothetical protein
MTYLEQIEQYVGYYPETAFASVPASCGVTQLPAYPGVEVHVWAEDYCELADGTDAEIARFKLVG